MKTGWMYYDKETNYVKASNVVYIEKQLLQYFLSSYHHGWMSEESQAESYNETWRDSRRVELVKKFLAENPTVGAQFTRKLKAEEADLCDHLNEDELESETESNPEKVNNTSYCGMFELHRKHLANAYYDYWIHQELEERKMVGKYLFGPYYLGNFFAYLYGKTSIFAYIDEVKKNILHKNKHGQGNSISRINFILFR